MIRTLLRQASKNSPFSNDWGFNSGNRQLEKRVSVNFNCYRENMIFNLNIIKAKFQLRDNYFSVKNRGYLVAEFIPLILSPLDPTRKIIQPKDKYAALINPENIYNLLHENITKVNFKREKENDSYELLVFQGSIGWEWAMTRSGSTENKRVFSLNKSETFYCKEFIKDSIPYIFGWNAQGDPRVCEQNMVIEQEFKDPFENV